MYAYGRIGTRRRFRRKEEQTRVIPGGTTVYVLAGERCCCPSYQRFCRSRLTASVTDGPKWRNACMDAGGGLQAV